MIDRVRFEWARARVLSENSATGGIGRLAEKSAHGILKLYYQPDESRHEVELLGSVCDAVTDNGAVEIQTASLYPLLPKLRKLLQEYPVTVVHPLYSELKLRTLDRTTGELSPPRRSPRHENLYSLAYDLYRLREILVHPNFSLHLFYLSGEEIRVKDGRKTRRGLRDSRLERIPTSAIGITEIHRIDDYPELFLPESLGDTFSAKDFSSAIRSRSRYDTYALRLLVELGFLTRYKENRAYVYTRVKNN